MKKATIAATMWLLNREPISAFIFLKKSMFIVHLFSTFQSKSNNKMCFSSPKLFSLPSSFPSYHPRSAKVTILPEIVLPHPVYGGDSNSLHKFRLNETAKCKLLEFQCKSHAWPAFVYQQFDASFAADKIIQFLNRLNIGKYKFYAISPLHDHSWLKLIILFMNRHNENGLDIAVVLVWPKCHSRQRMSAAGIPD